MSYAHVRVNTDGTVQILGQTVREIKLFGDTKIVTTGDQRFELMIPRDNDGMNLIGIESYVTTVSSSGKPTIQIRNRTQTADMLSTKCEIDVSEFN